MKYDVQARRVVRLLFQFLVIASKNIRERYYPQTTEPLPDNLTPRPDHFRQWGGRGIERTHQPLPPFPISNQLASLNLASRPINPTQCGLLPNQTKFHGFICLFCFLSIVLLLCSFKPLLVFLVYFTFF